MARGKMMKYHAEHIERTNWIPICMGLGVAWLLSLIWHYSLISLVLGIVFCLVGLAGRLYAQFAKQ